MRFSKLTRTRVRRIPRDCRILPVYDTRQISIFPYKNFCIFRSNRSFSHGIAFVRRPEPIRVGHRKFHSFYREQNRSIDSYSFGYLNSPRIEQLNAPSTGGPSRAFVDESVYLPPHFGVPSAGIIFKNFSNY